MSAAAAPAHEDKSFPYYYCPHGFKYTGESRLTGAWSCKTEEQCKCACGKG